jgi:hypothetical protein
MKKATPIANPIPLTRAANFRFFKFLKALFRSFQNMMLSRLPHPYHRAGAGFCLFFRIGLRQPERFPL